MASTLFVTAPPGFTLEDVRQVLLFEAKNLNDEREQLGVLKNFARVSVGSVLKDPRHDGVSLLISYSDHDTEVPGRVNRTILTLATERVNQQFFLRRGSA